MLLIFFFSGEPWYLRQLLLHKPAASYIDLKTMRASDFGKRHEIATKIRDEASKAGRPEVLCHYNPLVSPFASEEDVVVTAETVIQIFETFQEACVARGLCYYCLSGICYFCSPAELRAFFVLLTIRGFPTLHIFNVV